MNLTLFECRMMKPLPTKFILLATLTVLVQMTRVLGAPSATKDTDQNIEHSKEFDEAIELKEQANKKFKENQYSEALPIYTEAINKLQNLNSVDQDKEKLLTTLFYNTALAYVRTKNIDLAIEACAKAINHCLKGGFCLDYVKPFVKRAELYTKLGEYNNAMADYKYLLDLSKGNPSLRSYAREVNQKVIELEHLVENTGYINYYKTLGIKEGASLAEIKKAYRDIALKCHPDKNQSDHKYQQEVCAEKFKVANNAFMMLSNLRRDNDQTSDESSANSEKQEEPAEEPKRNSGYSADPKQSKSAPPPPESPIKRTPPQPTKFSPW